VLFWPHASLYGQFCACRHLEEGGGHSFTLCCGCLLIHTACPARFSRDPARFSILCQLDCFPLLVCGLSVYLCFCPCACLCLCLCLCLFLSCVLCLVSCVLCLMVPTLPAASQLVHSLQPLSLEVMSAQVVQVHVLMLLMVAVFLALTVLTLALVPGSSSFLLTVHDNDVDVIPLLSLHSCSWWQRRRRRL